MIIRTHFGELWSFQRDLQREKRVSLVPEPSRGRFGHLKRIYKNHELKIEATTMFDMIWLASHAIRICIVPPCQALNDTLARDNLRLNKVDFWVLERLPV
jgi:hypothetical protein